MGALYYQCNTPLEVEVALSTMGSGHARLLGLGARTDSLDECRVNVLHLEVFMSSKIPIFSW